MQGMNINTKKTLSITTKSTIGNINSCNNPLTSTSINKKYNQQNQVKIICRVCLQQTQSLNTANQPILKPCSCTGIMQYVHESCLLQWANSLIRKRLELGKVTEVICCQMCKNNININLVKKHRCRTRKQMKNTIQVYWPYLAIYIFSILISFGIMGILAYYQSNLSNVPVNQRQGFSILYATAWVFIIFNLFLWVGKIITNFIIIKESFADKVQSNQNKPVNNESAHKNANINIKIPTNTNKHNINMAINRKNDKTELKIPSDNPQTQIEIFKTNIMGNADGVDKQMKNQSEHFFKQTNNQTGDGPKQEQMDGLQTMAKKYFF